MAKPIIGASNLVYAINTKDDSTGATYQPVIPVESLKRIKASPKTETAQLYADNKIVDTASTLGDSPFEIELAAWDIQTQAALLGHSIVNGELIKKSTDVAPYVAVGYRALKSDQTYTYRWYTKVQFSLPEHESKTKEEKIEFQTVKLQGKLFARNFDNVFEKAADESDIPGIGAVWFTAVDRPADTVPPAVSSVVPANNAVAVAVGSTIVWTFSEAIQAKCVTAANFLVQRADASAQVAGALTLDATGRVVTFRPTANLPAATQFMALAGVGVVDLSGNAMAAPSVTRFTTA